MTEQEMRQKIEELEQQLEVEMGANAHLSALLEAQTGNLVDPMGEALAKMVDAYPPLLEKCLDTFKGYGCKVVVSDVSFKEDEGFHLGELTYELTPPPPSEQSIDLSVD